MLAGNKAQVKKKLKIGTEFQFIYCSLGFTKKREVSTVSPNLSLKVLSTDIIFFYKFSNITAHLFTNMVV